MVDKLFASSFPKSTSLLLDPGCGPGAFIEGVLRWCARRGIEAPHIVGIDSNPEHVENARRAFHNAPRVEIRHSDFLRTSGERFDYIIGNPPYVSITGLSAEERADYRTRYRSATNRFDLYGLFFEQALELLRPDGRLVFITPEKFLYVESAASLRSVLMRHCIEELLFLPEDTFGDLVTYPLVTTMRGGHCSASTEVIARDGHHRLVQLPRNGQSWLPSIGEASTHQGATLRDVALRISCGVATGADSEFVVRNDHIDSTLKPFSRPTLSGRQLVPGRELILTDRMLIPYDHEGTLLPEHRLGALGSYLRVERRKSVLMARTCAQRKPWYSFHENPPLRDLLRPKILCKDISRTPHFFVDRAGEVVPRHSVYYIVPRQPDQLDRLTAHLNSSLAREWLLGHCQRAAGGFIRLQSHVLKNLPIPDEFLQQTVMRLDKHHTPLFGDAPIMEAPVADVR